MSDQAVASHLLIPALARMPGHLIWRAQARVSAAMGSALPPGVDLHAYAVLLALAGDVARSQQELADTVSTSRTTMARVARDLVAAGLVDRVRNPTDRRSYALTRTPAGAATARTWRRYADDLESSITTGFTPAERDDLPRLLLALVEADLAVDVPAELRTATGFLITRIHAAKHRDFLALLEPFDIEPRDFGSLTALEALGPVPQADLARALGVSGPTIVEIVDRLESLGLVERRRSPADRRPQLLHLRPDGETTLAAARRVADRTQEAMLAPLSPTDQHRLLDLLRTFVTAPG